MSAAEIARGLTKAQREAFKRCVEFAGYVAVPVDSVISHLPFAELGLLTKTGLEVRAILEQEARDGVQ